MDWRRLADTPAAFREAYELLGAEGFTRRYSSEQWSPAEQLIHVRASNAILAPRLWQVVLRPGVALAAFDERALGDLITRSDIPIEDQLHALECDREGLLALLGHLEADDWDRLGHHELRGSLSVRELCASIVTHEEGHLVQLRDSVALSRS